jgi:hypothetical protein
LVIFINLIHPATYSNTWGQTGYLNFSMLAQFA